MPADKTPNPKADRATVLATIKATQSAKALAALTKLAKITADPDGTKRRDAIRKGTTCGGLVRMP